MRAVKFAMVAAAMVGLAGCGGGNPANGGNTPTAGHRAAQCENFAPDNFVVRNDLAPGSRSANAKLLLRFVQFTDDHIIDDEGQAINGAGVLDPLLVTFESAMRLQQEYSDEALNDMIGGVNACNLHFPSEFMVVTGDIADLTTVAELRRFIDNLDGRYDQISAFEQNCRAALPAATLEPVVALQCTRFTGRGVPDSQAKDPDPDSPLYQELILRTVTQTLDTEQAALTGRAADGSVSLARQTLTRASGLPEVLRCNAGDAGCVNQPLNMPWYATFGNHDGYIRGTLALDPRLMNTLLAANGRHYMQTQREVIDEFFMTQPDPGPVGHGFNFTDMGRMLDGDLRNDGYYATDAGGGKIRLIMMNTIVDGHDARIPLDLLRNPFALSDGSMDRAQFDWIRQELALSAARGQLAFVFSHHPDNTFAEFGMFAPLVPIEVTAAELDAELASWPHLVAWVAGHTHVHRIRPFTVKDGVGANDTLETPVACKGPGTCNGFWQIETASLIDHPQEQRMIEVFDNGDGTGTLRAPVLTHRFERSKKLAERDDRCALYLTDPAAVAAGISEAGLNFLCAQGGVRIGKPEDRNVELMFRMPGR